MHCQISTSINPCFRGEEDEKWQWSHWSNFETCLLTPDTSVASMQRAVPLIRERTPTFVPRDTSVPRERQSLILVLRDPTQTWLSLRTRTSAITAPKVGGQISSFYPQLHDLPTTVYVLTALRASVHNWMALHEFLDRNFGIYFDTTPLRKDSWTHWRRFHFAIRHIFHGLQLKYNED